VTVSDVGLRRATLDEVFLKLTGHRAEDEPDAESDADSPGRKRRGRGRAA